MLSIAGIDVQVVRKKIKNLNLAVYPPDGRVRLSVPQHVSDETIQSLIISKFDWIKQKQRVCRAKAPVEYRYETGEMHLVFGQPCRLTVIERSGKHRVMHDAAGSLQLFVRPETTQFARAKCLDAWYREQLRQRIGELLKLWQPVIGKEVAEFGIKKMKTRWGTCNIHKRRIWLNLELAKKPLACLEYVVVHEMVHLLERNHTRRFHRLMDQFLPDWRQSKAILNHHLFDDSASDVSVTE